MNLFAAPTRRERQAARLWSKRRHGRAGERTDRVRALARKGRQHPLELKPAVYLPRIELDLRPPLPDVDPAAMEAVPLDGLRRRPDGRVLAQSYRHDADRLHTALARGYTEFVGRPLNDAHWQALAAGLIGRVRWFNEWADLPRPGATLTVKRFPDGFDEDGEPVPLGVRLTARFPDLCYVDADHPLATEPPQGPDETRDEYLDRLRAAYRRLEG